MLSESFIEKKDTNIIKGVALIFMFIHHFFTFPDRLIEGISYNGLDLFAELFHDPFKICVSLFAFLTGYFYYFNKNKSFKYSFKKSTDLYINYVVILALMLIMDVILKCYRLSAKNVILELSLLDMPNMEFCWYVAFYIISILLLPLYAKIAKKSPVLAFSCGVVLPCLISVMINIVKTHFDVGSLDAVLDIIANLRWFPCIASGYLFASEKLFQKIDICRSGNRLLKTVVYLLFMIIPFFARIGNGSFDFVFAPMFIFGLVSLLKTFKTVKFLFPITVIGKYSLLMWFIHSVFFNVSKEYTQPILYYPHNPVLVLLWGIIICLSISFIVSFPINLIIKIKNNVLRLG